MKKKIASLLSATTLLLTPVMSATSSLINAAAHTPSTAVIAVDEEFGNLNILTTTKLSTPANWIYTMAYDTLLHIYNGELNPCLATRLTIVSDDSEEDNITDEVPFDWPERPSDWSGYLPLGWSSDVPFAWGSEADLAFFSGDSPLVLEIQLLPNRYFTVDGSELDAQYMAQFISYAKTRPTNTLIYKQWEPVTQVTVVNDIVFQLELDFSDLSFGFIDFLYSLASPIASIVKIPSYSNQIPFGTGAYTINSVNSEEVSLGLVEDWWQPLPPTTQTVTFTYVADDEDRHETMIESTAEIAVLSPEYYDADSSSHELVTGNPLVVKFNETNPCLEDGILRTAITLAIEEEIIQDAIYFETLAESSNDIWAIDTRDVNSEENSEEDPDFNIQTFITNLINSSNYDGSTFTILARDDDYEQETAREIASMLDYVDINAEVFAYVDENETPYENPEEVYRNKVQSGAYDLLLTEIDLTDINSAYKTLYSDINDNVDLMLEYSKKAANLSTYLAVHAAVQAELYNDVTLINLGWKTKVFAYSPYILDITMPYGFTTTNDISRVDFRKMEVA